VAVIFGSGLGSPDLGQRVLIAAVMTALLVSLAVLAWFRRRRADRSPGDDPA
jgi:hypothetical protein